MAALISALDTNTPKQIGENGHTENGWSNDIREKIVQFSFQITRCDENTLLNLKNKLHDILLTLKGKVESSSPTVRTEGLQYFKTLYKMIGQTRDIIEGKGEYTLTYMMIHTWYSLFPDLALFALKSLVDFGDEGKTHQYGSWKDIKYFCEYCKKQGADEDHPLIKYAIELINNQLLIDADNFEMDPNKSISLTARWVPREKSKFSWLFYALARHYFSRFIDSAKTDRSKRLAILKCNTQYRKLVSKLNRHLDTLQIKQCDKRWSDIDFNHLTSISASKQRKALLNIKADKTQRSEEEDRVECARKFKEYIQKGVRGEVEIKGKRIGMADFTRQALELGDRRKYSALDENDQAQIDLLNAQWKDNSTQTGALNKMIAMVDVSGSMSGDPIHVAVALGIRIAEKSSLGRRVMTFSSSPSWCNLDNITNFVDMVDVIHGADWGMNTNFFAALMLILEKIKEVKLSADEVEGMVLAIFSDMQIDYQGNTGLDMFKTIEEEYAKTGTELYGVPFKVPKILFWNLRSTQGFPALSTYKNAMMMSGFSPALLNLFCEKGLDALETCTPWSVLLQSLENPRYKMLEDKINETF
jgi:hypothetical protein